MKKDQMSVTWVTRERRDSGRGDRLPDYLLHTIKFHTLHRKRKYLTWPTSGPWPPAPPSVRQLWRFSRARVAKPMAQISRLAAAWSRVPNPAATWTLPSASGGARIESTGGRTS